MTITKCQTSIDRPLSGEEFVSVMSTLVGGVAVVTTIDEEGQPRGLTSTAFASVSADPPMVLICVDRTSRTLPALTFSSRFVVNLVADLHETVSGRFASKAEDKFGDLDWSYTDSGLPLLDKYSVSWFECDVTSMIEAGDHFILLAQVMTASRSSESRSPLLYGNRQYGIMRPTTVA